MTPEQKRTHKSIHLFGSVICKQVFLAVMTRTRGPITKKRINDSVMNKIWTKVSLAIPVAPTSLRGKMSPNRTSKSLTPFIFPFLRHLCEQYALPHPGGKKQRRALICAGRNDHGNNLLVLPYATTKKQFLPDVMALAGIHINDDPALIKSFRVAFYRIWRKRFPFLIILPRGSDFCDPCR